MGITLLYLFLVIVIEVIFVPLLLSILCIKFFFEMRKLPTMKSMMSRISIQIILMIATALVLWFFIYFYNLTEGGGIMLYKLISPLLLLFIIITTLIGLEKSDTIIEPIIRILKQWTLKIIPLFLFLWLVYNIITLITGFYIEHPAMLLVPGKSFTSEELEAVFKLHFWQRLIPCYICLLLFMARLFVSFRAREKRKYFYLSLIFVGSMFIIDILSIVIALWFNK